MDSNAGHIFAPLVDQLIHDIFRCPHKQLKNVDDLHQLLCNTHCVVGFIGTEFLRNKAHGVMYNKKNELVGWNWSTLPVIGKVPNKDWAYALPIFAATTPFGNCNILSLGTVLKRIMTHGTNHKLEHVECLLVCMDLWLCLVFGLVCNVPVSATHLDTLYDVFKILIYPCLFQNTVNCKFFHKIAIVSKEL